MWNACTWLNEPRRWSIDGEVLGVTTDAHTDFWRETHYGYSRESGHFFGAETYGDFTATLRVRGRYIALYDQAGIMVRADETHWAKAGIEQWDGRAVLGSVVTRGQSDWAVGSLDAPPHDFYLRATVKRGVLWLESSADSGSWSLMRLAPFVSAPHYRVGPMCCTPEREGLAVTFSDFTIAPAIEVAG